MDLSFITEFVSPIALVICLCVGYVIKYCVKRDTLTRLIPVIVALLGVVIVAWAEGAFTPQIVAMGLISGLASTGLYEAFKQLMSIGKESE